MSLYHYIALALFAGFVIAEWLFRARRQPAIRAWKTMGLVSALLYFAIGVSFSAAGGLCLLLERAGVFTADASRA